MKTLKLVGWRKGLQSISLMNALREHAGLSLTDAKTEVEKLLTGSSATIAFPDALSLENFRNIAIELGVIFEP